MVDADGNTASVSARQLAARLATLMTAATASAARNTGSAALLPAAVGGALPPPPPPRMHPSAPVPPPEGGISWGRESAAAAPPLHGLVARLLLAPRNAVLLSEVPEMHTLCTRGSARVGVEREAGAVLDGGAAVSVVPAAESVAAAATAAAFEAAAAEADEEERRPLELAVAQAVLVAVLQQDLVMSAATMPLPEWKDTMLQVPTHAELAPLQDAAAASGGTDRRAAP